MCEIWLNQHQVREHPKSSQLPRSRAPDGEILKTLSQLIRFRNKETHGRNDTRTRKSSTVKDLYLSNNERLSPVNTIRRQEVLPQVKRAEVKYSYKTKDKTTREAVTPWNLYNDFTPKALLINGKLGQWPIVTFDLIQPSIKNFNSRHKPCEASTSNHEY